MTKHGREKVIPSSGNVFADLQLAHPGERNVKAQLASKIYDHIEQHGWTVVEAAEYFGISQEDVRRLKRGNLGGLSIGFLSQLGS